MSDASDVRSYTHTPKPFGREVSFTLRGRELVVSDERKTLTAPLKEITQVRLTYEPRNTMARGFRTKLWFSNRRTASLTNLAWKSMIQVERQDPAYRAFVTALLPAIAAANPDCVMLAGQPKPVWLLVVLAALSCAAGFIWLIYRAMQAGSTAMALLTLVFAAYFALTVTEMIRRNRPRRFEARALPDDLLP